MQAKSIVLALVILIMACGNSTVTTTLQPTVPPRNTVTLVPTITPLSTNTPLPTATPTAQSSNPYYDEMLKRLNAYQAANIKFARQYEIFRTNPQMLTDANWKSSMESALMSLQVAAETLQNIPDKTPQYEALDKALNKLAAETLSMIKNFTAGIDGPDSFALEKARNNLATMKQYASRVNNELAQLSLADFALASTTTALPTTTLIVFPTSAQAACSCNGDSYNCSKSDFSSKAVAQDCYDYCIALGKGDVHDLDRDHDGEACDSGLN